MTSIPFNHIKESTLQLPLNCQCDACKTFSIKTLEYDALKSQIRWFGIESLRRA